MLVLVVLVPLFLGILQVALVLLVRNTLASAASEGARYAATLDRGPADGAARTREPDRRRALGPVRPATHGPPRDVDGAPGVEVDRPRGVPALGLGGPGVALEVTGHAVEEQPP